MNSEKIQQKNIIDIFNEMDFEENTNVIDSRNSNNGSINSEEIFNEEMQFPNELLKVLKIKKKPKVMGNAIEAAIKAQNKWRNLSTIQRANYMHMVWKFLKKLSVSLSKSKKDFLILVNYFDFNSDLAAQIVEYKNWKPHGVVLVILSSYSPFFVLGATVAPALASGCSVIVVFPENTEIAGLVLEEIFAELGLPEGLINVITDMNELNTPELKKIDKVFFCGSYLEANTFYSTCPVKSFDFFSPNNTAALILESSDLNAATNKIVIETWGKNSYFAVSLIVVQESLLTTFLEKLKYRIEQFMMENKNSLKFKDDSIAEKINNIIMQAEQAGALVEKSSLYGNKWSPTVLLNYQNQDIFNDVPLLRVLTCRTAKEGILLLNNCKNSFGTSVWSEISSQALEVSSMLACPNIWINCHGVTEASEPLQLIDFSGNCVLGGSDGILQYILFRENDPIEGTKSSDGQESNIDTLKLLQTAFSAHQAFSSWQNNKSRRQHLKEVAHSLQDHKDFSKLSDIVNNYAHLGNLIYSSEKNGALTFVSVKKKVPIGVILFVVNSSTVNLRTLVSLVTPALALGNAVILIQKEEQPLVEAVVRHFSSNLPKYLISVIVGLEAVINLASDPNVQAIWIYEESTVLPEFLDKIKKHTKCLRHIWVIPQNVPFSQPLFQKRCLKNKVIWQTKIDQFP